MPEPSQKRSLVTPFVYTVQVPNENPRVKAVQESYDIAGSNVKQLFDKWMKDHDIRPDQITPDPEIKFSVVCDLGGRIFVTATLSIWMIHR